MLACGPRSRTGRRAALVLLVPVLTALPARIVTTSGDGLVRAPDAVVAVALLAVPVVALLAVAGCPAARTGAGADRSGRRRVFPARPAGREAS